MEGNKLGCVTGCDAEGCGPPFEGRDTLFQNGDCRVCDPGIDIAESFKIEKTGCVINIVENETGGLIDRSGARTGCRVGRGARMDGESIEFLVWHNHLTIELFSGIAIW